MMSGSCRSTERRICGKSSPTARFTWICVANSSWYSIGSSIVTMFHVLLPRQISDSPL